MQTQTPTQVMQTATQTATQTAATMEGMRWRPQPCGATTADESKR